MKHNEILGISRKIRKKLVQSATDIKRDPNAESVHSFRVTYKKFRSFLCLFPNKKTGHEGLKVSNKLKSIYHLLGLLRDLQLLQNRLCSERTVSARDQYKKAIGQRIMAKKQLIQKFDIEDAIVKSFKKNEDHFPPAISLFEIELFRDGQWILIKHAITNFTSTDECIHPIRKTLKNLYFVTLLLRSAGQPLYQTDDWQGKDEAFFIHLMKELGDYNDLCNAVDIVSHDLIAFFPTKDPYLLKAILQKWNKEKLNKQEQLIKKPKTQVLVNLNRSDSGNEY